MACYAADGGQFLGIFAEGGGLVTPIYLGFASDGNLYVVGRDSNQVHIYHGVTGRYLGNVRPDGHLNMPEGIAIDSSDNLIVNSHESAIIVRIDPKTGLSHSVLTDWDD